MTLASNLRQKLSETPAAGERHEFTVSDAASSWSLHVTADRRDAWTTVAWEICLRRADADGKVAAWAQKIARNTSGLLEALEVVEVDATKNQALLRSSPPSERAGKVFYYELILTGTSSALMRRFEGTHDSGKREQVAFALTNEVLAKWVDNVTSEE